MSGVPRNFKPFTVLLFILFAQAWDAAAAETRATVLSTSTPNLRVGPGVENDVKRTLKEGDQVAVEKLEGEWYLVTTSDGQKGFIHRSLLKLAEEAGPPAAPQNPKIGESKEALKSPLPAAPKDSSRASAAAPAPPDDKPVMATPDAVPSAPLDAASQAKSPSVLQMLEGRETELKIALLVAAVAFVLGWICGGNYYLRREHRSRRKLHF